MTNLATQTLPDVEHELVALLLAQPELAQLDGRIYTTFPAQQKGTPATLVVRRYGGEPVIGRPLVLDECTCQVDVYGGRKSEASDLAALVRALLSERTPWVALGAFRYVPDETFEPTRPRFVVDCIAYLRPHGLGVDAARQRRDGPSASAARSRLTEGSLNG